MNLNDDVVYRCLRLGPLDERHPGGSRSPVRYDDRLHMNCLLGGTSKAAGTDQESRGSVADIASRADALRVLTREAISLAEGRQSSLDISRNDSCIGNPFG